VQRHRVAGPGTPHLSMAETLTTVAAGQDMLTARRTYPVLRKAAAAIVLARLFLTVEAETQLVLGS